MAYSAPEPPCVTSRELMPRRVWAIKTMPPADMLRAWSKKVGGRVFLGADYFLHQSGQTSETYILEKKVNPLTGEVDDIVEKVLAARECVRWIIGKNDPLYSNPGWHFAKLARTVIEWLGITQRPMRRTKLLVRDWHYQMCQGDTYDHMRMYDMSAAYWQIVERVQSPKFFLRPDYKIAWQPLSVEEQRRWDRMKKAFAGGDHKRLRLAIVGASSAGWNTREDNAHGITVFKRGEPEPWEHPKGALQPLALLAVRCTYEVCQIQAEISRAVYANADCVVTDSTLPMQYWDTLGIKYKMKAEGPAHLCDVASYKIGELQTRRYYRDAAARIRRQIKPTRLTDPWWHHAVLKAE